MATRVETKAFPSPDSKLEASPDPIEYLAKCVQIFRRPPIEFMGMVGTGKTGIIERISWAARRRYQSVTVIKEGIKDVELDKKRRPFLAHLLASMRTVQALQRELVTSKYLDQEGVILIDRGPHDRLTFSAALVDAGQITEAEEECVKQLVMPYLEYITFVFVFLGSEYSALARKRAQKADFFIREDLGKRRTIMNPETLEALLANNVIYAADFLKQYFSGTFGDFRVISTDEAPEEEVYHTVKDELFPRVDHFHQVARICQDILKELKRPGS
jgi:hypothetical protein